MNHLSVLLNESVLGLNIKEDGIYVDGTLGRGGHSLEILKQLKTGHLYSIDKDDIAINCLKESSLKNKNWTLIKGDYRNLKELLARYSVNKVDGILLDIGVSSPQFDEGSRGFSYRYDYLLDMRMDQSQTLTAKDVVNKYSEEDLKRIFYEYGEERYASLIALEICKARKTKQINTTFQLVEIIKNALPSKVLRMKGHPAKKTFQAIRIEVNDELTALKEVIEVGLPLLNSGGRFAIITFHSLEDRIVKQKFESVSKIDVDKRLVLTEAELPKANYKLVNKKPILPSPKELEKNNRAKSAKLRIIERK